MLDATRGTSSPAPTLFRADLRRIWSGRTVRLALLVVLGILSTPPASPCDSKVFPVVQRANG